VLSQNHFVGYAFSVEEVVRLGRYAHRGGLFSARKPEDEAAVEEALERTGLAPLRRQSVLTLSGGELQRTFLAQVFAQNPRYLLLDEPTNHLDLVYQKQIFKLIAEWLKTPGRAVVSVVHDLSLAKAYGTQALLLHHGKTVAYGEVQPVMSPENLNAVYDMDVADWMRTMLGQWTDA
jgi:iron complex transport system ATP-binding protein